MLAHLVSEQIAIQFGWLKVEIDKIPEKWAKSPIRSIFIEVKSEKIFPGKCTN